jgi:membrane protease YdiL (CAAX protease family)
MGTFLSSSLGLWTGFVLTAAWVSERHGTGRLAEDTGLRFRPIDLPLGAVIGMATQLVALPLLYWPISKWVDLDKLDDPAHDLSDAAASTPAFVLVIIGVAIVAPIVEELFFRGVLLPALADRFGEPLGIGLSAAVFALFHFDLVAIPGLILIGVILAVLVRRTGRLGPAIVAHIAFNAVVAASLTIDRY